MTSTVEGEMAIFETMVNTTSVAPPFSGNENTAEYDTEFYYDDFQVYLWSIHLVTTLFCLCGLVGNSMVIWFLSFRIKRNPFTTYILNLAVADFGTLSCLTIRVILMFTDLYLKFVPFVFIHFTYSASVCFLTAISLERCLSVLFPIWYRCQRPRRSSAAVSFLLWIILGLLSGMLAAFHYSDDQHYFKVLNTMFTLNLLIFTPIMIASTLVMTIKICRSSQRRQPPRLYITISVTLLFFMIFAVPLSAMNFHNLNRRLISYLKYQCSYLFASVNSSINPIIYYFVGRGREKRREPLRVVLKRALGDDAMRQGGT